MKVRSRVIPGEWTARIRNGRLRRGLWVQAAGLALLGSWGGCAGLAARPRTRPATLSVKDVLDRCVAAHARARTIRAVGLLRDHRDLAPKVLPIRWDYARPDRSRLQIGMDVALVRGGDWWTYDSRRDRFKSHRQITDTPIETSAYFLSDGIPLPLVALMTKGKVAFDLGGRRNRDPWRMRGVAWKGGRPCYVLSRTGRGGERRGRWTVWIDQDRFLLRGWAWEVHRPGRAPQTIWSCAYDEMVVDAPMPSGRFQVRRPRPIVPGRRRPGGRPAR